MNTDLMSRTNDLMEMTESSLHGKRILIVQAAYDGKLPLYERAHALGAKLVVLDGPHHWASGFVATGLFEAFIEVDLRDDGTRLERALAAIRLSGLTFDAVATFWELATILTAEIAKALGLSGHRIESVSTARNKYQTRLACVANGIPAPRFARIRSLQDIRKAAETVGFPAVLKPVAGVSSLSAYRVNDIEALLARYQQTALMQQGAANVEQLNSNENHAEDQIWQQDWTLILEEFLDGDEFDIDCLLSNGELVYASVTGEDPQPDMLETGLSLPAIYPLDKQAELVALAQQVLKALHFTNGGFHVEAKYTSHGPRLLEVNARLGGKFVHKANRLVWGVDLVEQHLLTCLGLPVHPEKADPPLTYLAVGQFVVPYSGIINGTGCLDHLQGDPRIIQVIDHIPPVGQHVNGPDKGLPDCLGEVMVCSESSGSVRQILAEIMASIHFPILPDEVRQLQRESV